MEFYPKGINGSEVPSLHAGGEQERIAGTAKYPIVAFLDEMPRVRALRVKKPLKIIQETPVLLSNSDIRHKTDYFETSQEIGRLMRIYLDNHPEEQKIRKNWWWIHNLGLNSDSSESK